MPPVSKWVNLEPSTPSAPSPGVVNVPMEKAPSVEDAVDLLMNTPNATISVSSAPCPEETITSQPILPGTNSVLQMPIDPHDNPAVGVPLILDALNSIIQSYDQLKTGGRISTPFGNNSLKERESVIQQTYWMYTSALRDKPYDKSEFVSMTNRQLEQNTGKKAEDLPAPEQEKYAQGIDDFWGTFSLVGTESKLLTSAPAQPATQPTTTQIFESFEPESLKTSKSGSKPEGTTTNPRQTVSDPTEAPTLVKDEAKGECKCGDITIKIEVWEMAPQPDGKFKGVGSPVKKTATASAAKSTEPHEIKVGKKGLKNGVRIGVDLESVSATCPCEGNAVCDIFKDANEAKAHADAVKAHDKVVRDNQSALDKAKAALAKAQAALEEAGVKAKYDKAIGDLTSAEAALKAARDARAAYDNAEKAYKEASDAHTAAKGKEAKASAKAVKDAAKIARDKAKDANPTDSKIRTLEAAEKTARDNVNRMEKDVKEAQDKINEINKKIADAMAKVLENSSGVPSMKDGDGKDVAIGTLTEFNAVKQGNAKMEFKLTVSFQCTSPQCASTDCSRTFVIKIEE